MIVPSLLTRFLNDAPPRYAFEVSEAGVAGSPTGRPEAIFREIDPGVISVSPVRDNVLRLEALTDQVKAFAPKGDKKRQPAALILPDYSVRVSVLDFDSFPSDPGEQVSLVRFRLKKSLPFELDSARISYYSRPNGRAANSVDVVAAVATLEIVSRYEMPFRSAGFHTGLVTTSTLAALDLVRGSGVYVLAKLSGNVLTLALIANGALRLLRSIGLAGGGAPEIVSHLYPTFAYAEDQLESAPEKLIVCGFPQFANELREELAGEANLEIEPLRSRYGMPDQSNAGLLGYLESLEEAA
jgi:type IV pilus assembly protein PilM